MVIAFFGHSNCQGSSELEAEMFSILKEKIGDQKAELLFGAYGNFDNFAYQCAAKYKRSHPNTSLVLVTPYRGRDYENEKFDIVIYPGLEKIPYRFAIAYRNRWMIDQADLLICYIDHSWGAHIMRILTRSKRKCPSLI